MEDARDFAADGHLDLLRIDAVRAGEGSAEEKWHVAACPACASLLADFEAAAAALRRDIPAFEVTPERDAAILARYRETFDWERHEGFFAAWRRWVAPAAGLAAAAAVALTLALPVLREASSPERTRPAKESLLPQVAPRHASADINGDGVVDVRDALRIAQFVRSAARSPAGWDVNGDGRVDERDVESVAREAVAL